MSFFTGVDCERIALIRGVCRWVVSFLRREVTGSVCIAGRSDVTRTHAYFSCPQ